jgi:hypothetical protein
MPSEKSRNPDGFIGAFFKKCLPIIKDSVMGAIL